jgi:uncharacterized protein
MDPVKIIKKYYNPDSRAYHFLIEHSRMVTKKALTIAEGLRHLNPDPCFIQEAAMLHDIGIFMTYEPRIGCYGDKTYICHGYLGREILEKEGFPRHSLVCERHVGVGLSVMRSKKKIFLSQKEICCLSALRNRLSVSLTSSSPRITNFC